MRLGELEVGDIFELGLENYATKYRVIDHLSNCTMVVGMSFSHDKKVLLPAYVLNSDVLVKKVDNQEEII